MPFTRVGGISHVIGGGDSPRLHQRIVSVEGLQRNISYHLYWLTYRRQGESPASVPLHINGVLTQEWDNPSGRRGPLIQLVHHAWKE